MKNGNMFASDAVIPQKQINAIVETMKGEPEKCNIVRYQL
jgi:hypothetical protein